MMFLSRNAVPWLMPNYGVEGGSHGRQGGGGYRHGHHHHHEGRSGAQDHSRTGGGIKPKSDIESSTEKLYKSVDLIRYEKGDHDCLLSGCQRIIINVSGQRFETQVGTLSRFPGTLLGDPSKRRRFWDRRRNEIFIDRHRPTFQAILYYYQSGGRLCRPVEVPEDVFIEELKFYQIDECSIDQFREKEGIIREKRVLPGKDWQRRLWLLCEEPNSSIAAKLFAALSVLFILVSIVSFCMETIPTYANRPTCINVSSSAENFDDNFDKSDVIIKLTDDVRSDVVDDVSDEENKMQPAYKEIVELKPNYGDPFFIVETTCVAWFVIEFLLRLVSCPSKREFCRDVMNIFDLLAILPFFISLLATHVVSGCDEAGARKGSFLFTRVLRVFRIFKLSKHSHGLRILGLTLKTSMHELGMFFFFLAVAMVIFSSAVYYAEAGEEKSQIKSIPGGFWWAIVTMTTVGYGDVTPVGVWGKMVGTLCVIAGVLTIALPVPVVVANFNNFYRQGNSARSCESVCSSTVSSRRESNA